MITTTIKRALLSVSDKTGLVEFAENLVKLGVEILSTGGTSQLLQKANVPHREVNEITHLPEMLDGRVKTLHHLIHGGILAKRDQHENEITKHGIHAIDLVVVNFYPFAEVCQNDMTWEKAVEYIDIGGPTMVRAAAKNFAWVGVVVDPQHYEPIIAELNQTGGLTGKTREMLAQKAFALTSTYDAMIHHYFLKKMNQHTESSDELQLQLKNKRELRYGENPHQRAYSYELSTNNLASVLSANQLQGKPLSYNNILDAEAAFHCVNEFKAPACVIVKHGNPCGAASAACITDAYHTAFAADSLSAFGGVVALNETCNQEIAAAIAAIFMEVIIAPAFTPEALAIFAAKPNLRLLQMPMNEGAQWEMRFIQGGVLVQEKDHHILHASDLKVVTVRQPEPADMESMLFAWPIVKYMKSNAILIAKDKKTVGIGAGQVSRVDAVDLAIKKAADQLADTILASDAFFPFRDSIDRLAKTGIRAIIQPGGSVRDDEVIAACNEHDIAMVFTGKRCFRH